MAKASENDLQWHQCPLGICCALHSQSSGGLRWCDDSDDPSGFEICPIPKKRSMENKKFKIENSWLCGKCGHINGYQTGCLICRSHDLHRILWKATNSELIVQLIEKRVGLYEKT